MIDIHSHILHGFDDGARSIEDSILIVRQAVEDGTSVLFATPHLSEPPDFTNSGRIVEAAKSLETALTEQGISVRILPGAEVFPSSVVLESLDKGLPITLGDKRQHILLEMPFSVMPLRLDYLIFELQTRGITPILAHPERSAAIQAGMERLEEHLQKGLLIQINATSLLGANGKEAAAIAFRLLEHNWVHFVASDTHSPRMRPSRLKEARDLLADTMEADAIDQLFVQNGQRIIDGEPIPSNPKPYSPATPVGLMARFRSFFSP